LAAPWYAADEVTAMPHLPAWSIVLGVFLACDVVVAPFLLGLLGLLGRRPERLTEEQWAVARRAALRQNCVETAMSVLVVVGVAWWAGWLGR
jgi:hypothetical protein